MLSIGNKKYRNLQEQVGFNTEQIEKIFQTLDGLSVTDNVIVISDLSNVLTSEELEIVQKAVAFIVYDGQLYIKKSEDASKAYFDIVFTISASGGVVSFTSKEIEVTLSNGALAQTTSTNETYSSSQIDTMVGAKADITYVDAQLALKADLAGATFTGAVTAPTLDQSSANWSNNLSFGLSSDATSKGITISYGFRKIIKINGALHVIFHASITNTSASSQNLYFLGNGTNVLPDNIASKIYDMDGVPVSTAVGANCLITVGQLVVSASKTSASGSLSTYNFGLIHPGINLPSRISFEISQSSAFTIPAGETRYLSGRVALTLVE